MPAPSADNLRRNVALYPWYEATVAAMFWLPVFFLYFTSRLSLARALQLEAIYYAAIVVMEVPSGYFSDLVGRRLTLGISSVALLGAYILFFLDGSFATFAAAQVCLAVGFAFHSGTNTAFHNDSLEALGESDRLAAREAIVSRNGFFASAVAALAGGLVAAIDLRFAYALSAAAAIGGFILVLMFVEPFQRAAGHDGFIRSVRQCGGYARQPMLMWLFAYAVFMTVLNHVPYEFFQSYIDLSLRESVAFEVHTPLATGIHVAITMWIGSFFAARSVRIRDRVGIGAALLIAMLLQTLIIGAMAAIAAAWIVPLILLRSTPRALMTAPLNAAVAPRVPATHRATYLSLQSLAGRLGFAALLAGLSTTVGEPVDWSALATLLRISVIIAIAMLIGLTIARPIATQT
ncbi:MFS transporter [Planctomycetales bacterium ZRK34]|nr:MFS transporter [Planctomycetales bacterium ZRK34]